MPTKSLLACGAVLDLVLRGPIKVRLRPARVGNNVLHSSNHWEPHQLWAWRPSELHQDGKERQEAQSGDPALHAERAGINQQHCEPKRRGDFAVRESETRWPKDPARKQNLAHRLELHDEEERERQHAAWVVVTLRRWQRRLQLSFQDRGIYLWRRLKKRQRYCCGG